MSRLVYLAVAAILARAQGASSAEYTLPAGGNVVKISVEYPDPYLGRPLLLYGGPGFRQTTCLAAQAGFRSCPERFVGAMAVVHFTVSSAKGQASSPSEIGERVTVVAQSPSLSTRAPFTYSAKVVDGAASDIQLFGYDETALAETERESERLAWKPLWRLYRQELYLDSQTEPFAVIEWRHTISGIRLLSVRPTSRRKPNQQPHTSQ